jgi:hypothetical protein
MWQASNNLKVLASPRPSLAGLRPVAMSMSESWALVSAMDGRQIITILLMSYMFKAIPTSEPSALT